MPRIAWLSVLLLASAAAGQPPLFVSSRGSPPDPERDAPGAAGRARGPDGRGGFAAAWPGWVRERDRAVRERLVRGEEDALVNLLFFGTSFTKAPRLTSAALAGLPARETEQALMQRLQDLVGALESPGHDERLVLSRSLLDRLGPPAGRDHVTSWLLENVARVRREQAAFAAELGKVRTLPDTTEQLAARSTLFRERGIALDTSLRPAFALDDALRDALERGLVTAGSVRRVAVVGPGLDFVDKAEGQDFYPPQSLQALALVDSLVRLGLSRQESLSITAFDISPRVLDHLDRARARAAAGRATACSSPGPTKAGRRRSWRTGGGLATRSQARPRW